MKTNCIALCALWCMLIAPIASKAQTDTLRYLESGFETLADQQRWASLPPDNNKKWIFQEGALEGFNPDTAYKGEVNAYYFWADQNPYTFKLVSPAIDLSDSKKPQLSFAHAMLEDIFGLHSMKLLFKAGPAAQWDTIASFGSSVDWSLRTYNIKDFGTKYLCEGFQLAFEGTSGGGHGICIDEVVIEEKDVIFRFPKSVKAAHVQQDPIPSGALDIPVMRLDIVIVGNTDPAILDSVVFTSLSTHDSLFASGGFELVATRDSVYRPTTKSGSLKIGNAAGISGGKIEFKNFSYSLPTGYNAIWLIADMRNTAPHKSQADFSLPVRGIRINSLTYPTAGQSPTGSNTIERAVFYDSFEANSGWVLASDFETAVPQGKVAHITTDPDFAYSGAKVLGTDLTVDGKYRLNISEASAYYAVSPEINLRFYDDVKLNLKKWIAIEGNDHGVIEVTNDNGSSWHRIWDSKTDALSPDNNWVNLSIAESFDQVASRQPAVKIRFGIVFSDANFAYAGFNIDNLSVTGNYLTNDVGIVSVEKPVDDCHNPGMDTVKITVKNYADRETGASLPVFFSLTGSDRVYDTIPGPLGVGETVTFSFTRTASFPAPGDYSAFSVKLEVAGDQDPDNDTRVNGVYIQNSYVSPHLENFENSGGFWRTAGEDPTWLCRTPEGSIPVIPGSPKAWILSPFGNYLTNDTSFIVSSCYDLSQNGRHMLDMMIWMDSEPSKDGALFEYSTDNGHSWQVVTPNEEGYRWNWYNSIVAALGDSGWSGINTQGWVQMRQLLPASLINEPKVKFRVKWASDDDNTYRGMAVDEVNIYPAPADIAITAIDSFATRCQYINPDRLTVTIGNMGVNKMNESDTIIVGFDFNGIHMATDTFRLETDLLPGQHVKHTFNEAVDVTAPGNYSLTAYTLMEEDPYFYINNNDTLRLDFEVKPNPLTFMPDTIPTRVPDTVTIVPYYNVDYDYLWHDLTTDPQYNVLKDGWHQVKVTATRGNGCISYDSTYVLLLFNDTGIDSLLYPVNHCGLTGSELPVVRIRNFGTDSIPAGETIEVAWSEGVHPAVKEQVVLERPLFAGHTLVHAFTGTGADLRAKGLYPLTLYAHYPADTIHANDTLHKTIEIFGHPAIYLGADTTVKALSHMLNAGAGFVSYLWDNGSAGQTRLVEETGDYWVQVYDTNQCDDSDTVHIRLKIRDVRPNGLENPVSDCRFTTGEPVIMRIINSGTDTVPAGEQIRLTYTFNQSIEVEDTMVLADMLLPLQQVAHIFKGGVNLTDTADYPFSVTTQMIGDMRFFNDTSHIVVYRYPRPETDFGLDEIEYVEDIELLIDAGNNPDFHYSWQDGYGGSAYLATESGNYRVTVTDPRTSCADGDTVILFLIYTDVGVVSTSLPDTGCSGIYPGVAVRVKNLGTSSIGKDVPIYVVCQMNGTLVGIDTLVRTSNFITGNSLDLVFSVPLNIPADDSSTLVFHTLFEADMKPWNDSLQRTFVALPSPVVDFGDANGYLQTDLPHLLNPGEGHLSYLWHDGSSSSTFLVTEAGEYGVAVTGQNGCVTEKSVMVNLLTGLAGLVQQEFIVYPNPGNGIYYLKPGEWLPGAYTLQVFDSHGQIVYNNRFNPSGNSQRIDLQQLPAGLYQLVLQKENLVYRAKVIRQ